MNAQTILVSSAGRRNQLMDCFRRDAATLGVGLRVIATDVNPALSPACQQADASFAVPRCTAPDFIPALCELCRRESVGLLVPTIDTELAVLSQHVAQFAAVGTRVVVSSPVVVAMARDKQATTRVLLAAGINAPRTVTMAEFNRDPDQLRWPVIAKPTGGSSSIGIIRPGQARELCDLSDPDYLVQELWQGREYTVNAFFDQTGQLRCAVPHERLEVRAGEVSKGVTRRISMLEEAARRLAQALPGAVGPLCFQAIVTESGDYVVFEINARFGGGYPLTHRAGARFSQWLLEEVGGLPVTANNDWKEGLTMLRYDSAVFLND